jgi:hypothetical protein
VPAVKQNLTIEQGTDWSHGWAVTVNGDPIDDTWTARAQIRGRVTEETPLHTFAAEVTPEGAVVIAVTPEESSPWTWNDGVYDVEVVNADESLTLRVAEGHVLVDPEVTR